MHSNILEWASVHSKKNGVNSCPLQSFPIFGMEWCPLQFFWSGLQLHSKIFGVDSKCTSKFLEWNSCSLQKFWSASFVHSKKKDVDNCILQEIFSFWSGQRFTPNILEWTACHSKKVGVHTFSLQMGVHEVKCWSAFSLTLIF
jgi:hypothetical protein